MIQNKNYSKKKYQNAGPAKSLKEYLNLFSERPATDTLDYNVVFNPWVPAEPEWQNKNDDAFLNPYEYPDTYGYKRNGEKVDRNERETERAEYFKEAAYNKFKNMTKEEISKAYRKSIKHDEYQNLDKGYPVGYPVPLQKYGGNIKKFQGAGNTGSLLTLTDPKKIDQYNKEVAEKKVNSSILPVENDIPQVYLPEFEISSTKTNKYPYYNQLTKEEQYYFNLPGNNPITTSVKIKASTGKGINVKDVEKMIGALVGLEALETAGRLAATPQAYMVEAIEQVRGNPYNYSDAKPNVYGKKTQRAPSDTILKNTPKIVQVAGDIILDPVNALGIGSGVKAIKGLRGLKAAEYIKAVESAKAVKNPINFEKYAKDINFEQYAKYYDNKALYKSKYDDLIKSSNIDINKTINTVKPNINVKNLTKPGFTNPIKDYDKLLPATIAKLYDNQTSTNTTSNNSTNVKQNQPIITPSTTNLQVNKKPILKRNNSLIKNNSPMVRDTTYSRVINNDTTDLNNKEYNNLYKNPIDSTSNYLYTKKDSTIEMPQNLDDEITKEMYQEILKQRELEKNKKQSGGNLKYQVAGPTNYAQDAVNFLNKSANSKRGLRKLKRSTENKADFMYYYNNRKDNLAKTTFQEFDPETFEVNAKASNAPFARKGSFMGLTRVGKDDTSIPPKVFINKDVNKRTKGTTYTHEAAHAETYGGKYLTEKEIARMEDLFKKYNVMGMSRTAFNDWYNGDPNKNSKYTYAAEPDETRARLKQVEQQMAESGIRDVFNKRVRVRDLKNYDKSFDVNNMYRGTNPEGEFVMKDNPLRELRKAYNLNNSDGTINRKQLKKLKTLFNKTSYNDNTNNKEMVSKFGGTISFKNYSNNK